jgi:hypothetical protein
MSASRYPGWPDEAKAITEVLSVDAVRAAYAATGLAPTRDDWGDGKTCACAAGVLLYAAGVEVEEILNKTADPIGALAEKLCVRRGALANFTDGFDGKDHNPPPPGHPYREAFDHGRKVAEAVFSAAPSSVEQKGGGE